MREVIMQYSGEGEDLHDLKRVGELVRCDECKWHDKKYFCCNTGTWGWDDNDYCSAGQRKEET
jgi:hypothetical protein